jgi:histidinol-phosphatase (PHP family)
MKENFHTHLPYCCHAQGNAIDYVRKAEELGFRSLGFSDHSPSPSWCAQALGYKMRESELETYRDEVRAVASKTSIPIYLGMEVDIISSEKPYLTDVIIPTLKPDYLLGSVHFLISPLKRIIDLDEINNSQHFDAYMEQLLWAVEQPEFLFIGHPDRIMAYSYGQEHEADFRSAWRALAQSAKRYNKPLEYNSSLCAGQAPCLSQVLWQEVLGAGAPIVVTSDAHEPARLGFGLEAGYAWLAEHNANIQYCSQLLDQQGVSVSGVK